MFVVLLMLFVYQYLLFYWCCLFTDVCLPMFGVLLMLFVVLLNLLMLFVYRCLLFYWCCLFTDVCCLLMLFVCQCLLFYWCCLFTDVCCLLMLFVCQCLLFYWWLCLLVDSVRRTSRTWSWKWSNKVWRDLSWKTLRSIRSTTHTSTLLYLCRTTVYSCVPRPHPAFRAASDEKLGGAWERG